MNDPIETAVSAFRALLEEQLARKARIENAVNAKNFAAQPTVTVGLIDGDGIGPLIMRSARSVLEKLLKNEIEDGRSVLKSIDGLTLENRLKKNEALPGDVLEKIRLCDVLLKGPTATPHGGTLESANVALRRELDLYANVRPVRIPEKQIDWIFFRENSEGEYVLGSKGVVPCEGMAVDFKVITAAATERIARAAFNYAAENGKKSVTVVTKANILKKTDGLFSEVCRRVAIDYPQIEVRDRYIDIMTAELINDAAAPTYEVFVLPNLYGDILTDEAAQIGGGVGTAGSANVGARYAMFEAIHGSAPRMIEEGLGAYANPSSILRAAAMMLRHIGMPHRAQTLDTAIDKASALCPVTGDRSGATTEQFTRKLLSLL